MGLFGKIKNIFYDEEIIEVPSEEIKIKKEEKPRIEEVHIPRKDETREIVKEVKPVAPVYTEREIFKTENSFKFPIIDEDEEPIRTRTRANILDIERKEERKEPEREIRRESRFNDSRPSESPARPTYSSYNDRERTPEKVFKPSPIISPVYGVLDRNYKKEEIIERQNQNIRHNPSELNYDYVRRKAYGTLEDELENTLSKINSINTNNEELVKTFDEVEKLDTTTSSKSIEDLLNEIEVNRNVSIGELEERLKDRMEEEEDYSIKMNKDVPIEQNIIKEEPKEKEEEGSFDKTLEHDLFNLIDSMYEEREGE